MAYLALARKWRPQTFDDLVGQGHVARTLSNAIRAERISHGYLFTGTRGIGKTSAARIFAKVLRCQDPIQPGIPCGKCTDCREIAEGRSVDVLEIDGASNNGVDAVREIRDNAKYLPSTGKHKIYIIDEVHMLTTAAFNALLKTLEEPPTHVLFIFATTDPQKIPATVLSRCQRFDFKRVSQKDLQERLHFICQSEKVSISNEALAILAREAEGSMRDAISLLDQVLAVGDGEITAQTIASALGLVDKQTILDCVRGILTRKPILALEAVGKVYLHGFDLKQFGREILRYLRQIMVARLVSQRKGSDLSAYLDVSDADLEDLKGLIQERSLDDLDMLFRLLNHGLEDVARSSIPKMVLDALIIKMASAEELVQVSDLDTPPRTTESPDESHRTAEQAVQINSNAAEIWRNAVEFVRAQKPLVGSILENMGIESINRQGDLTIITLAHTKDHSFYRDQLQSRAYSEVLAQLLKNYLGHAVRLEYKEVLSSKSLSEIDEDRRRKETEDRKRVVLESEAMKATQQLLGARLERLDIKGDND